MLSTLTGYVRSGWNGASSRASTLYSYVPSVSTPEFVKRGGTYVGDGVKFSYNAVKSRVPGWFPCGGYVSAAASSCFTRLDSGAKWLGFKGGLNGISKLWQKAI
jgi:hypothetical protein